MSRSAMQWMAGFLRANGTYDLLAAFDAMVREVQSHAQPGEPEVLVDAQGVMHVRAMFAALVEQAGEVRDTRLAEAILRRAGVDTLASYSAAVNYAREAREQPERYSESVQRAERTEALRRILASLGAPALDEEEPA